MKEQKIIYEPHPVTPERKAELRGQGYKIIDARFKPAGQEDEDKSGGSVTVAEIREALTARGIEFDQKAKKAELLAMLQAAESNEE